MLRILAPALALAVCGALEGEAGDVHPPIVLPPAAANQIVTLPDGELAAFRRLGTADGLAIARVTSPDEGRTWREPEVLFTLPEGRWMGPLPLITRAGETHLFLLHLHGEGRRPGVDRMLDVCHVRSLPDGGWSEPQLIFAGYVGAIVSALELDSGRLIVPFGYHVPGRRRTHPTGEIITTVMYSDDGGATWRHSGAELTSPCFPGFNGNNHGACEPAVVQRADGVVWMVMRTQTGRHYESFSDDGVHWTPARPSRFYASSSPCALTRLDDGRLVLFWNNCAMPPRVDGQGVYGGRDVLHAAISDDNGRSWRGYREIYRDPLRHETPPERGDRGTAYPGATVLPSGDIAVCTGQGAGERRALILVDPEWLCETHAEDDFSGGVEHWSAFTSFGPAHGYWRDRAPGPEVMEHPDAAGARVLHLRRADDRPGDGAVWNFPAGRRGELTVRLMMREGGGGCMIALADRFFNPTDTQGEERALFLLPVQLVPEIEAGQFGGKGGWYALGGGLMAGARLRAGRWYELRLAWDCEAGACEVFVNGERAPVLPQLHDSPGGPSYLRLRSTADAVDEAGVLVERVAADVENN